MYPRLWAFHLKSSTASVLGSYSGHLSVRSENIYNHAHTRKDTNYFIASNGKLGECLGTLLHCFCSWSFQSSGVVSGSLLPKLFPSSCHRTKLPERVYQGIRIPEHQFIDLYHNQVYILPCISMVTSLVPRITFWCLIFVCFSHRMMRWFWIFWIPYKAYQCHWTFYR